MVHFGRESSEIPTMVFIKQQKMQCLFSRFSSAIAQKDHFLVVIRKPRE